MRKRRVLIVEDSPVVREFLEHIIGNDSRLEVVGSVDSAEKALRNLDRVSPDIISMDIRLPGMNGFEATRRIMSQNPTPIVVVSDSTESEITELTARALQAGALTVLRKPVCRTSVADLARGEQLCTQLAIMSHVGVVTRREHVPPPSPPQPSLSRTGVYRMLGIVSSTGGPKALEQLLSGLGPAFPLPILLVQHIDGKFLEGFATWLSSVSPFLVEMVASSILPARGKVYISIPDHHLRIEREYLQTDIGDPVCVHRPSGNVLFKSMAKSLGSEAIGVLLTGMGDDGAQGLLRLREAGGYTIAENESTAVVYGMPAEAVRLGAVRESLPLSAMAARISELVSFGQR